MGTCNEDHDYCKNSVEGSVSPIWPLSQKRAEGKVSTTHADTRKGIPMRHMLLLF